jgi:hypothetical protein
MAFLKTPCWAAAEWDTTIEKMERTAAARQFLSVLERFLSMSPASAHECLLTGDPSRTETDGFNPGARPAGEHLGGHARSHDV